ncbi:MAG: hypothetical protein WCJ42_01690 [Actinomycetes bacterium]
MAFSAATSNPGVGVADVGVADVEAVVGTEVDVDAAGVAGLAAGADTEEHAAKPSATTITMRVRPNRIARLSFMTVRLP